MVNALSVSTRTWPPGVASRLEPHLLQRDREEPDGHLLAGGRDDIELARIGMRRQLLRQRDQPVGLAAHRRDDDDELVSLAMKARDPPGDIADAVDAADRGAAVFLDDQCHGVGARSRRAGARAA